MTIFRALEGNMDADDLATGGLGWAHVAVGGFVVIDVSGAHLTMLAEPNVEVIATTLRQRILGETQVTETK